MIGERIFHCAEYEHCAQNRRCRRKTGTEPDPVKQHHTKGGSCQQSRQKARASAEDTALRLVERLVFRADRREEKDADR